MRLQRQIKSNLPEIELSIGSEFGSERRNETTEKVETDISSIWNFLLTFKNLKIFITIKNLKLFVTWKNYTNLNCNFCTNYYL